MKIQKLEKTIEVPEGVTIVIDGRIITAKGNKGEILRKWDNPRIKAKLEENIITLTADKPTNREKKDMFTLRAHIINMQRGVIEGHIYKLKICSGHFPMNVSVSKTDVSVKNFLGEKVPRVYKIKPSVDVKLDGDFIIVESCSKEIAGDTAASIERLTRITNRDRRIFQDGIYIIMKDGKEIK
ncbi:MAG: 50S ribosomal protein L6 [Nanoarchaeota archaeon]|nr:50S ribosomal protein L6 [Nanoarchaeota archaeon]